jgi:RNA polymerase sigma-70 factor (ECF subfamily)
MADTPETSHENAHRKGVSDPMPTSDLEAWFVREVLPLEAALTQFLYQNWRNKAEIPDLLQDVYLKVFAAAQKALPQSTRGFVFTTAQNLLIDRMRRDKIVPIEMVADLDALNTAADEPGPDRKVMARDELRRLQQAIARLPPRCREALLMKQIEGLSRREIAVRMGISENTAKWYLSDGLRALTDMLYGEDAPKAGRS